MKNSFLKYFFICGIVSITIVSCVKKTNYPTIPEIEFKNFIPYADESADLQIKFTDGDGDIGVSESDSSRTLYYTYYYKDTITQKYIGYYSTTFNDTLRNGYVVKAPNDSYQGKPISGECSIRIQQFRHSKKIKHIKYVIYLFDKAGNKSNVITTPEIKLD